MKHTRYMFGNNSILCKTIICHHSVLAWKPVSSFFRRNSLAPCSCFVVVLFELISSRCNSCVHVCNTDTCCTCKFINTSNFSGGLSHGSRETSYFFFLPKNRLILFATVYIQRKTLELSH